MTNQRKFTLIWLLLPLLFLRGLVPTGFMIDMSGGGLSMVICSGSMSKTMVAGEHAGHAMDQHSQHHQGQQGHHDQSQGDEHHGQQSHGDSICPFAAAATVAPTPSVLPVLASALSGAGVFSSDVAEFHSPFGPSRVQQSRAPPFFS